MKKNNGGSAFPLMINKDAEQGSMEKWCNQGMTLRDYFASNALPNIIAMSDFTDHEIYLRISRTAFKIADAMIAERNK